MSGRELPNYRWIKFGLDYLNDPDFMQLADATAGVYLKLYLLAGRADAGGYLCNGHKFFSEQDLSWQLRIDQKILEVALTELIRTGLVIREEENYLLAHFLKEQGPGDNTQRNEWAERQRRHREKVTPDEEKNREEKKREDKIRGEEIRESPLCHGDVKVTEKSSPATPDNFSFRDELANQIIQKGEQVDFERLDTCLSYWKELSKREGWAYRNPEAILELYSPGGLEERRKREDTKVRRATQKAWGSAPPITAIHAPKDPLENYDPELIKSAREHQKRLTDKRQADKNA